MTRTTQRQDFAQDNRLPQSINSQSITPKEPKASLHAVADSASDNDVGERPVREKLKKTSIASIPKYGTALVRAGSEDTEDHVMVSQDVEECIVSDRDITHTTVEPRGRPIRKRSFDDLEAAESILNGPADDGLEKRSGHARKRSTDIRIGNVLEDSERRIGSPEAPVPEEDEMGEGGKDMSGSDEGHLITRETDTKSLDRGPEIQGMTEAVIGPRRKRSRDHFDTEADREQKIAATDEAKAQRKSEESEREGVCFNGHAAQNRQSANSGEVTREADLDVDSIKSPTVGFTNTSATSPFATLTGNTSSNPSSVFGEGVTKQPVQASTSAFASSGFAALSGTSASPFGTFKASSAVGNPISTNDGVFHHPPASMLDEPATERKEPAANNDSGIVSSSKLGTSGTYKFGTFDRSAFSSGFGSAIGNGSKLTSFAAPSGDTTWGIKGETASTFGAPAVDEEAKGKSDDDGESAEEEAKDVGTDRIDSRFQHQDVDTGEEGEETVFSSRACLYHFDGKAWIEGGRGIFKLNVTVSTDEALQKQKTTARFIMRAQQTYRVILNAPVFKQMSIGDSKGNEPSGKSSSFAVVENGKPIPYMIRVGNEGDNKTLFHEVRALQNML